MKVLKISYGVAIALFTAWMVLSWFEIGFNNCVSNYAYHPWNLWIMMMGLGV